jgi:transcriptional regulator with XRE-family HTH domain
MYSSGDFLSGRRKIIARNIRARRRVLELTQVDLADALGVSADRIRRIESGKASIDFEEVQPLCESLGIEDQNVLYQQDYYLR